MRIAVYSPTFPPVIDGTSVQAKRLVDSLNERGYNALGVAFAVGRDIREDRSLLGLSDGTVRVRPVYSDEASKFPALSGKNVIKEIRAFGPEAIHIRGWYQLSVAREMIDAFSGGNIKIFWHADGLHECHNRLKDKPHYKKTMEEAIAAGIVFIANSKHDVKIIRSLGSSADRIKLLPPILQAPAKYEKRENGPPIILSVGRFIGYKNQAVTAKIAKRMGVDAIIAGPVGSADEINMATELAKGSATILANPSESLIRRLYSISSHFLSASERETLGISTLEAVLAGLVPLVRKNDGIVTYLRPDFIFSCETEMERKLRALLVPKNTGCAIKKLSRVRAILSPERVIAELISLYEK